MRYTQLRAFDCVAREGSFSRAAQVLRLTQPAVTVQVRGLEEVYGLRLFERRGNRIDLTGAGAELFALTRQMFAAEAQVQDYLTASHKLDSGELRLSADGPHVALPLIAAFRARFPGIRLEVSLGSSVAVWQNLLDQRADAVVVSNPPKDQRSDVVPLGAQSIVAIAPRGHPLAGAGTVSLKRLRGAGVIRREPTSNLQRQVSRACKAAGVALNPVLELGSQEAVREAAALGLGLGFATERETDHNPRLAVIPVKELRNCNAEAAACLRTQRQRRTVAAFLEVAREVAGG